MSDFLYHTSCPKCGSSDNLGVYDDGHSWCWGCRYFQRSSSNLDTVKDFYKQEEENKNKNDLPFDYTVGVPIVPLKWLRQYNISNKEIIDNKIGWSSSKELLIFPYYEEEELLMWQGRFFPTRKPKTLTYGFPEKHLILLGEKEDTVVVVEDPVSAIAVSRVSCGCPLFGANLSVHKAIQLSRYFNNLIIYLDNDKIKEMFKFQQKYAHIFKSVKICVTDKDPKYYDEKELDLILKAC